jgi:hypothetical protein
MIIGRGTWKRFAPSLLPPHMDYPAIELGPHGENPVTFASV